MDKRFRFVYGETHEDCTFADDFKRTYINSPSTLINFLNDYYNKCNVMEEKLEELGFKVVFKQEVYDMINKKFKKEYSHENNADKDGEYMVLTKKQYEDIIKIK